MPSQFDLVYKVDKTTPLTADVLNVRFRNLDTRLVGLEALNISWQAALAVVQDKVLGASEAVIASLRDRLVKVTQLEWLVAGSGSTLTLVEGDTLALLVLPDDRALFAPGPYSVVSDVTDPAHYAVVRSLSYDRDVGQYDFKVVGVFGGAKPGSNWQVAAVAGSTLAQRAYLDEGRAARKAATDAAAAARADRLLTDADAAQTALDRQATGADAASAAASAAAAERLGAALIFTAQSATAAPIGLGAVTVALTTATMPHYAPLSRLALISAADARNAMAGNLVSYDPISGNLTLMVDQASGLGSPADWIVTPAPPPYLGGVIDGGDDDLGPPPPYQTNLLPADFGTLAAIVASAAFTGSLPTAPTGRWGALYLDQGVAVVDRTGPAPGTSGAPPLVLPSDFSSVAAFLASPAFTASLPTARPTGGGLYLDNDVLTGA